MAREQPNPGRILFGKYEVIRQLGRGGVGAVWLVRHRDLNVRRALKTIQEGISDDPEARDRFRREAEVMARFVHPHAVSVHDSRAAGGDVAFIEMEYVEGQPLDRFLRPGEPMPLDWIARILEQLCDVLQVASEKGIVHRDLKPSNLMLLDGLPPGREHLKVLDFGIAKLVGDDARRESSLKTTGYLGTPSYSSPEQCKGYDRPDTPIDSRSDLYSVGVILYEWLTGHRPFVGDPLGVLHDQIHTPAPPFAAKADFVEGGPALERFTLRCLAKSPAKRPQTPHQLYREFLDAIAKDDPTWLPEPSTKLLDGANPERGEAASGNPAFKFRRLAVPAAIAAPLIIIALVAGFALAPRGGTAEVEPPRVDLLPKKKAEAGPAPAALRIAEGLRADEGKGGTDGASRDPADDRPDEPPVIAGDPGPPPAPAPKAQGPRAASGSIADDLREYRSKATDAGRLAWLERAAPSRIEAWHRGALAGDAEAQFLYGACLAAGAGATKDEARAVAWYEKAADLGETQAMISLGSCYESGAGVRRDPARAADLYKKAADLGDEGGSIALAGLQASAIEAPPDTPAAAKIEPGIGEEAREPGSPLAELGANAPAEPQSRKDYNRCAALGAATDDRDAFIRENIGHLEDWQADATAGKPWAQYLLAKCRLAGIGVPEDPAEAVRLFLKAAAAGEPLSMQELGDCYEAGIGVAANPTASKRWHQKARKLLPGPS